MDRGSGFGGRRRGRVTLNFVELVVEFVFVLFKIKCIVFEYDFVHLHSKIIYLINYNYYNIKSLSDSDLSDDIKRVMENLNETYLKKENRKV